MKILKYLLIGVVSFFALIFIFVFLMEMFDTPPSEEDMKEFRKERQAEQAQAAILAEAQADSLTKAQLDREIESTKSFDNSAYDGEVASIQLGIVLFATWGDLINKNIESEDEEIKSKAEQLKKQVVAIQKKNFPILRKRYAKAIKSKLWESDIEVDLLGSNNTVLAFTGGIFAANKNKKEFNDNIWEVLKSLRFKQTRYKWYSGESEYTYWDLEPPADTELVLLD